MIDDEHSGIANILNLPRRSPVRTPKVETQVITPELTKAEFLMSMKPLNLPKTRPEKKDQFGYTKKQNREIENQITRPKVLKDNINSQPKKKIGAVNYVEKIVDMYEGDNINSGPQYVGNRSDNPSWMKDLEKTGPYGKNKRFVNKTLNKFENRTDNKDVVTFNPTTQLFTDETRNIAFKSYDQAKRWNDAIEDKKDVRKSESVSTNKHRRLI